jgi:hypothetical protein
MKKTRSDKGKKRRSYKKRVVGMNKASGSSNQTAKYGQRGAYLQGTYSDRSPQEDAYRKRQLELDQSRIRRQNVADGINMAREGRGWINSLTSLGAFF